MSDEIQLVCDRCHGKFTIDRTSISRLAGQDLVCPHCGRAKKVPPQKVAPAIHDDLLRCPDCKSDNCQRAEMIYDAGTTNTSGLANTLGLGSIGGVRGWAGGITGISTSSQSNLAAKVGPPEKQSTTWHVAVVVLLFTMLPCCGLGSIVNLFKIILPSDSDVKNEVGFFGVIGLLIGLAIFSGGLKFIISTWKDMNRIIKYNREEWPLFMEAWQKQFVCLKCGRIWIPDHLKTPDF